jgi:hypothetical protein
MSFDFLFLQIFVSALAFGGVLAAPTLDSTISATPEPSQSRETLCHYQNFC